MKYLVLACLLTFNALFADFVVIPIRGTVELEDGDVIPWSEGHRNLTVEYVQVGGDEGRRIELEYKPRRSGDRYEFNEHFVLREDDAVKFDRPIRFKVYLQTAFGNYLWVEDERDFDELTDSIRLENYSERYGGRRRNPDEALLFRMNVSYEIRRALQDRNDAYHDNAAAIISIRHIGMDDYIENIRLPFRDADRIEGVIDFPRGLDPRGQIDLRVYIPTRRGNYIWARKSGRLEEDVLRVRLDHYSRDLWNSGSNPD